jgi:hypothetical protein
MHYDKILDEACLSSVKGDCVKEMEEEAFRLGHIVIQTNLEENVQIRAVRISTRQSAPMYSFMLLLSKDHCFPYIPKIGNF